MLFPNRLFQLPEDYLKIHFLVTNMFERATLMLVTDVGAESIIINITVAVNKIFVTIINVVLFSGAFKC